MPSSKLALTARVRPERLSRDPHQERCHRYAFAGFFFNALPDLFDQIQRVGHVHVDLEEKVGDVADRCDHALAGDLLNG